MGATDFLTKRTPHLTPMLILGSAFVGGNLSIFLVATLKEMQTKAHTPGGVDMFDFAILLAGIVGSVATSTAAYMNRSYTRYADEQDKERERKRNGDTAPPIPVVQLNK